LLGIIPASNSPSIPAEQENVEAWARNNNQSLNLDKTAELMVSLRWTRHLSLPAPLPGMTRVETLTLLGVVLDRHLLFTHHVTKIVAQASQSMYALKVLESLGLAKMSLDVVCRATLVDRMLYASPCWWGAILAADRTRL